MSEVGMDELCGDDLKLPWDDDSASGAAARLGRLPGMTVHALGASAAALGARVRALGAKLVVNGGAPARKAASLAPGYDDPRGDLTDDLFAPLPITTAIAPQLETSTASREIAPVFREAAPVSREAAAAFAQGAAAVHAAAPSRRDSASLPVETGSAFRDAPSSPSSRWIAPAKPKLAAAVRFAPPPARASASSRAASRINVPAPAARGEGSSGTGAAAANVTGAIVATRGRERTAAADPSDANSFENAVAASSAGGPRPRSGGLLTIPMLCLGIALVAACVLVPLADENRHVAYEREKLKADLEQVQQQVAVNDEFLKRLQDDPTLAQRLAQRQMHQRPQNAMLVDDTPGSSRETSPFLLVSLPPPPAMPPYRPVGGVIASYCLSGRSRLYLLGIGMMLCAAGLVLGGNPSPGEPEA